MSIEECVLKVRAYDELFSRRSIMGSPDGAGSAVIFKDRWTILCDGSWCASSEQGGFEAVLMKDGQVFACRAGWADDCPSPLAAEVHGVLAGLDIAKQLNLSEVDVVFDCVEAVWGASSGAGGEEAFLTLAQRPGWSIRHIFRDLNGLADAIAGFAREYRWEWSCTNSFLLILTEFCYHS